MARVQGRKEYMPAALSRYDTARSALRTGCTIRALITAKNKTLAYNAPSTLIKPAEVVTLSLQKQSTLSATVQLKNVTIATPKGHS